MERIVDRLDKYAKTKGLNDNTLTIKASLSVGLIGKARKNGDLGKNSIEKILNVFPDLNRVWLLTGSGEMLIAPTDEVSEPRFNYDPEGSRTADAPKNVNVIEAGDNIAEVYKALLFEKDHRIKELIDSRDKLCREKDSRIRDLESWLKEKDEIIRTLRKTGEASSGNTTPSTAASGM